MDKKIAFLQTFGILLVVLGHSHPFDNTIPYITKWIYSFHMPLFMFISGYLFYLTNRDTSNINIFLFIRKKFKRLLLPYLIISSLAWLPKLLLNKFSSRPLDISFQAYIHSMIYPLDNPIIFFWFLPTLFIIMVITILVLRFSKGDFNILFCTSLLAHFIIVDLINVEIFNFSGVCNYLLFFVIGALFAKENKFSKLLISNMKYIGFFTFILLLFNCTYPELNIMTKIIDKVNTGKLILPFEKFFFYQFYYTMIAISGIILSVLLAHMYTYNGYNFFDYLEGKSYTIYLLSWFPQVFVRILGYQILHLPLVVIIPFSFIFGVYIPLIIRYFIGKYLNYKFLSIIIGK